MKLKEFLTGKPIITVTKMLDKAKPPCVTHDHLIISDGWSMLDCHILSDDLGLTISVYSGGGRVSVNDFTGGKL